MKKVVVILATGLLLVTACKQLSFDEQAYNHEMQAWRKQRLERLKSDNGWLNLAGLYWLEQGANTFGSDSSNGIIFPAAAPAKAGTFFLKDTLVTIEAGKDVNLFNDSLQIKKMLLRPDNLGNPTRIRMGSLGFHIIKRGNKYGVRLRDFNAPLVTKLDTIPAYPVSVKWIIKARYEVFEKPVTKKVNTVIDVPEVYVSKGKLIFTINGMEQTLIPFEEGKELFIIFADSTSAIETYGPGRFMDAPAVDATGYTTLDFNKAYNPPCAFTPFATCPLPPRENILMVKIEAGEKDPHIYQH